MMLRRIAHPLLAAAFVVDGVDTLLNPETRVKSANDLVQRGQQVLPERAAAVLPNDPARLVQVTAAVRVGGGLMLATGRLPRISALILAATTVPATLTERDFWNETDQQRRSAKRTAFLRDAGLLGGLLIAAADTGGRPSVGWRARRAADRLSRKVGDKGASPVAHLAEAVAQQAPVVWESLRDKGGHLAEVTREQGAQLAETVRDKGGELAETARDRGGEFAELARERTHELADTARDKGGELADTARDRGGELADHTRGRARRLAKTARARRDQAAEVAADRGAHLGELARERGAQLADRVRG
ncbi:DoxX family membrane protein [Nocardia sp. NBC_00511]|uniref:DoxX family membrane protein n=1 Tax=Nocardia sp. NBC_00511 TaxID=2903591 RepID=UPI0030E0C829